MRFPTILNCHVGRIAIDSLRPWACQLRRLWSILNDRPTTQRANYAAELAAFQVQPGYAWLTWGALFFLPYSL